MGVAIKVKVHKAKKMIKKHVKKVKKAIKKHMKKHKKVVKKVKKAIKKAAKKGKKVAKKVKKAIKKHLKIKVHKKIVKKAVKKHLKIKKGLKIKVHKKLAVHKVVKKAKTCNVSKNGRCGPKFNHTICPVGKQCSKWNWCGVGGLYLSTQQAKYNGRAGCAAKPAAKKPAHKKPAHKKPVAKKCNVSKNGRCGPKFNHTICAWGQCSRWSWCGNGGLYLSTQQKAYNSKPGCAAKKVIKKAKKVVDKAKPIKVIKKKAIKHHKKK